MIWLGAVFSLFMLFYAAYLLKTAWHFSRLKAPVFNREQLKFSVIIPARNEAASIKACLQAVFAQDYPKDTFEVILVNDHSEDETKSLALQVAAGRENFSLLDLSEQAGPAYKKAALAAGIAQSKGEIILCTDADCRMGPGWLRAMASAFTDEVGMVSGPVALDSQNVFGHFQALEFMGLIAVGAGSIAAGQPNMCNGANLAYRKSVFEEVGGFAGIDHIASGDDELLMHKIASETSHQVAFVKSPEAVVYTDALPDWAAFRAQRLRWVSKSTQYKKSGITMTLVISWLAVLGLPLLAVLGLFFPALAWLCLANLGLKILAEGIILFQSARFFNKLGLLIWLLPEQIAHIAYVLWVGIAANQKGYTWKGRQVQ